MNEYVSLMHVYFIKNKISGERYAYAKTNGLYDEKDRKINVQEFLSKINNSHFINIFRGLK